MSRTRPTFSESWYRVEGLRPRLRAMVQTFRQHYRGQMWHVVRDPANNQFFRLNDASYFFVGLLNGERTVAQAWEIANAELGDRAPTQPEVIQLLGQLYASNLLVAELPADSGGIFDRYRKKVHREIRGYLSNLLFVRIPLWDPDHTLNRWVSAVSWVFSPIGLALWVVLIGLALMQLAGQGAALVAQGQRVLDPSNWIYLYISMAFTKALHELGHGFACKKYGRDSHSGGEVHTIGVMFLILVPVPYVDASSAWALRNRWQRAIIGAAGMYVELAVAAIAAIVWTQTAPGAINSIAYNTIFIASVSTLLFNGNPLLRFDGYYILSDLIEIPNLAQRSKDYLYYLVKRYVFGSTLARYPMIGAGERPWFVVYGIASTIYRVMISIGILLFVWKQVPMVGVVLASVALVTWVFVPLGKFLHYLAVNDELSRVRPRAVWSTVAFASAVVFAVGILPVTEHARGDGVVEPNQLKMIYTVEDGFIEEVLPTETLVREGDVLMRLHNVELETRRDEVLAHRRRIQAQLRAAEEATVRQIALRSLAAIDQQLANINDQIDRLHVRAPMAGRWIAPHAERMHGLFMKRGERVGMVAAVDDLIVRVAADQLLGPRIKNELPNDAREAEVDIRVRGRPDVRFAGRIREIDESGKRDLPSAALGYLGGGTLAVTGEDQSGTRTAEAFFEVVIDPTESPAELYSGQRVVVRFDLPKRPLLAQWIHGLRQLIQRRFEVEAS